MIPANNTIPYTARPMATLSLITICIFAYLYQSMLDQAALEKFLTHYAMVPKRYFDGEWAASQGLSQFDPTPFITSMFLHGSLLHIAGNLWTLWVFGPALEDRLGPKRYLALYFISGIAAGLLHLVFNISSAVPALGASGAIAGVIAAYARRFPYAWVNVLQPIVFIPTFFMMPALLFAGFWFFSQVVNATGSLLLPQGVGGVAWWAHIGGFVAGYMLVKRLSPPADPALEANAATRSFLWPFEVWRRWVDWWLRRMR